MKILSLFSGVGGFDLGLEAAGMETVFQCEWDKHATSVLKHRWPDVPKWGDISTLTGKHVLEHAPVIDVVAWGSPCQDLSIAGKRAGLSGAKSGLFHEGIRVIKEIQEETNGQYPRISIWENVVGALSSNKGADFGVIIDEMAEAGALAIEWAVLDAQHFGVPQRRRRVFVVAIFDPVLAGRCPDPLLPVSESLPGHLAKGKPKRKSAATTLTEGFGSGSYGGWAETETAITLSARDYKGSNTIAVEGHTPSSFVKVVRSGARYPDGTLPPDVWREEQTAPTLSLFDMGDVRTVVAIVEDHGVVGSLAARDYKGVGNQYVAENKLVIEPILIDRAAYNKTIQYDEYNQIVNNSDVSTTIRIGRDSSDFIAQPTEPILMRQREGKPGGGKGPLLSVDKSLTLAGSNDQTLFSSEPTLTVRRLTPLECERLMGWPDGHTRYKADGTEQSDTQRYKQCGNGIASPVAAWIGKHVMGI